MNRLRQIRERKSLSLAQVSARTSIPIRLLTDYEQGSVEIPAQHLKALSKALWVKPEELLPAPGAGSEPVAESAVAPAAPQPQQVGVRPPLPAVAAPPPSYAPRPQYQQSPPPPGPYTQAPPRPPGPPPGPRPQAGPGFAPDGGRPPSRGKPRREPVPMPATEGQVTEIMRLAARLNLSTDQLTEKFSRSMSDLSRFDAREWIKVLREEAMTKAPPAKVHFGNWPGLKDDLEAVYLNELRIAGAALRITLFNGESFEGQVIDFTPYTITLKPEDSSPVVLRKLAVAYYRQSGEGTGVASDNGADEAGEENDPAPFAGPATPAFAQPPSTNGHSAAEPVAEAGAGDES